MIELILYLDLNMGSLPGGLCFAMEISYESLRLFQGTNSPPIQTALGNSNPIILKSTLPPQPPASRFFKKESPTKRQFTFVAVPFDRRKGYIFKKHPSQHEFIST